MSSPTTPKRHRPEVKVFCSSGCLPAEHQLHHCFVATMSKAKRKWQAGLSTICAQ
jgi:hypothetical protein